MGDSSATGNVLDRFFEQIQHNTVPTVSAAAPVQESPREIEDVVADVDELDPHTRQIYAMFGEFEEGESHAGRFYTLPFCLSRLDVSRIYREHEL